MERSSLYSALFLVLIETSLAQQTSAPPTAKEACGALSLGDKVSLMHGFGPIDGYSRNSGCGGFCGRATFRWDNGPQGFGDRSPAGNSTQWPSTLNIAATWDPALAGAFGLAMGEEWWGKGTNILEGPGINIMRVPHNGRTFEYISGEDPVLGSVLVGPTIDAMQMNAMAIAKHYILNNQETDRSGVNELVDEQTIMELYAPPFAAAAAHKIAGYMCAYNRINGVWACEQPDTLKRMLKGYFNFSGFVVSDWGACHSSAAAINAGLDIEMPTGKHINNATIEAELAAGNLSVAQIDDSCERIMSGWYALPAAKRYPCAPVGGSRICINRNVSTPEHKQLARKIAAQSTVLLKNSDVAGAPLLPLKQAHLKLALIGSDALAPYTAGGGSGHVADSNVAVSPLSAFTARGFSITYTSGCTKEGKPDLDSVAAAAAAADVALVFVSATTGEGYDRADLALGRVGGCGTLSQEELIVEAASKQPKTIVSMVAPGPVLTSWRDKVAALLCAFLPGEQYGNAIADIILGDVPPQAKLPVSMPHTENDQNMSAHQWPGIASKGFPGHKEVVYSEGQINGYRWYDKHRVAPAFPFGFGLSYATFSLSRLVVRGRTVSFSIARQGGTAGCETPQLYISYPGAGADPAKPVKVLRFFQKVCVDASLSYTLTDRDVSSWDVQGKAWVVVRGTFGVYVGHASQGSQALVGNLHVL